MKIPSLYLYIAGVIIQVQFQYVKDKPWIHEYFSSAIEFRYRDFIIQTKKKADFTISVLFKDKPPKVYIETRTNITYIEYCQQVTQRKIITYYHVSLMAFNEIILKLLDKKLSRSNGFILHASAILHNKNAYIFLAKSGGGKTTLAKMTNAQVKVINDDNLAIKKTGKQYQVFILPELSAPATPNRIVTSNCFPIKNIFFIEKSTAWHLQNILEKESIQVKFLKQLLTHQENRSRSIANALKYMQNNYALFFQLSFPKKPFLTDFIDLIERSASLKR